MSLPKFPEDVISKDCAINLVITSIAMEELALSHIINAEGEKLQYVIGTISGTSGPADTATVKELLEINKSVCYTLENIIQSQYILKNKMQYALCAALEEDKTPFEFYKKAETTGAPLAGAIFQITKDGKVIATATSDAKGLVKFGNLNAGEYEMKEAVPPVGYQPITTTFAVVIECDGTITVDGDPLADFEVINTPV